MSSTNKTTNYQLSQYIGTDKPTYLGDYNGDMNKIDAAIKAAKDAGSTATSTASSAESKAEAAQRTAGEASASADAAQKTADSAKEIAQSAQTTATGAAGNASSALSKAQTAEQNVTDITNKNIWTAASGIGNKGVTNYVTGDFHANYNEFSKLLNIYGQMEVTPSTTVPSGTTLATLSQAIMNKIGKLTQNREIQASLMFSDANGASIVTSFQLTTAGEIKTPIPLTNTHYIYIQCMICTAQWT